jgi:hypothetical protein
MKHFIVQFSASSSQESALLNVVIVDTEHKLANGDKDTRQVTQRYHTATHRPDDGGSTHI